MGRPLALATIALIGCASDADRVTLDASVADLQAGGCESAPHSFGSVTDCQAGLLCIYDGGFGNFRGTAYCLCGSSGPDKPFGLVWWSCGNSPDCFSDSLTCSGGTECYYLGEEWAYCDEHNRWIECDGVGCRCKYAAYECDVDGGATD